MAMEQAGLSLATAENHDTFVTVIDFGNLEVTFTL